MRVQNAAETELFKYRRENPNERALALMLFMKNISGFELYPTQLMDADETFRHTYALNCKPPRTGKSRGVSALNMYETFMNQQEDLRIYAPKWDQAREALGYIYDWIDRSKLLKAYVRKKGGKPQLTNSSYELLNGSNAKIYSIRGEIEGHNVTIMHLEEFDLWPWERFQNDVMRRGLARNANGLPTRIRITGTIMGKENIYKIASEPAFTKRYRNLMHSHEGNILGLEPNTMIDIHTCMALGIIDKDFVEQWQEQVSPDEWARSGLLLFTESKNFIWSSYLTAILRKALEWELEGVPYRPGGTYGDRKDEFPGFVSFGLDCGHAGSKKESSKYSLQIVEKRGDYRRWLNGFEWKPDYDTGLLQKEIFEILAFYKPQGGYGDALNHTLISNINQMAYDEGLTNIRHTDFGGNSPSNWEKWWFAPLWNDGRNKHFYYDSLKNKIHTGRFYFPFYDKKDNREISRMCHAVINSISNIREEVNESRYNSYYPLNTKISDDPGDALGMANFWIDQHTDEPVDLNMIKLAGKGRVTAGLSASVLSNLEIERENFESF